MSKRDEAWLMQCLDDVWGEYFAEVPQPNIVRIEYGRKAKRRLGSIRLDPTDRETSIITINRLFADSEVPEFIVKATIFHELCHYTHGFNSPLERTKDHPHAGGVMRQEFAERGALGLYKQQKQWLKEHWVGFVEKNFNSTTRRKSLSTGRAKVPKPFWFIGS